MLSFHKLSKRTVFCQSDGDIEIWEQLFPLYGVLNMTSTITSIILCLS